MMPKPRLPSRAYFSPHRLAAAATRCSFNRFTGCTSAKVRYFEPVKFAVIKNVPSVREPVAHLRRHFYVATLSRLTASLC